MNEKNGARAGRGRLIVYCLFGLMFFFSISATMTGILIPDMTAHYALSYGQVGLIGSVQSVGGFAATLLGGVLSDRFPKLRLICIMFAVYTLMLYALGLVPPYGLLIACFLVLGTANSFLNLLISAYISERCPDKRTSYLNICHAFYGLGSLAGPIYASVLLEIGIAWNHTFLWFGVFCTAVTLLLVFICRWDDAAAQQRAGKGSILALLRNPGLLLVSFACLLYMGQQSAVNQQRRGGGRVADAVLDRRHARALPAVGPEPPGRPGPLALRLLHDFRRDDDGGAPAPGRDRPHGRALHRRGADRCGVPLDDGDGLRLLPGAGRRRDLGGLPRLDDRRHGHPAAGRSSGGADLVLRGDLCDPGHAGALLARADGLRAAQKFFLNFAVSGSQAVENWGKVC